MSFQTFPNPNVSYVVTLRDPTNGFIQVFTDTGAWTSADEARNYYTSYGLEVMNVRRV